MFFKRKQVLCSDCGFLGWRTELPDGSWKIDKLFECSRHARQSFQAGDFHGKEDDAETGESYTIHCLRLQWTLVPYALNPKMNWVNADIIKQPRRCPYYIKYEPGFGPEEHKELKREAETKRTVVITSFSSAIIGAIIGAAVVIILQLIST